MEKINCLIIEDEPLATEILSDYISQVPFLNLEAQAISATDGIVKLHEHKIDLLFLDIHLPGLKGFDMLKTLREVPPVIVTTAYHQYAIEGYELDVLDYLLKPIDFARFLKAVNKVNNNNHIPLQKTIANSPVNTSVLLLKEGRKHIPVLESEIEYIEAKRDYVLVVTESGSVKTKSTLSGILERLSAEHFLRIHKSFIVPIAKVKSFSTNTVRVNSNDIPLGRSYLEIVRRKLKG